MADKIKVVCPKCGSDDVTRDGVLYWDVKNQCWAMAGEFDEMTCQNCHHEGHSFCELPVDDSSDVATRSAADLKSAANLLDEATSILNDIIDDEDNFISSEAGENVLLAVDTLHKVKAALGLSPAHAESDTGSKCDCCGETVAEIIGCPDGREVCSNCFDNGEG